MLFPGLLVPKDCVFQSPDPALAFFRVLGLEVERLAVDCDDESRVVLEETKHVGITPATKISYVVLVVCLDWMRKS